MIQPKLLDLFCCQGGASVGYQNAGFQVTGVDLEPQPRYPIKSFFQRDALEFVRVHGKRFDAIHASPPCQAHTRAQKIQNNNHPDLLAPTRYELLELGKPFVIENVVGAPLKNPKLLCGAMFGIETYRHRLFETNWDLTVPTHPEHLAKTTKMGRPPVAGEFMHIVGNFSGADRAREIMGMPWASQQGLREAIPPIYTEYIGKQLIERI